MKKVQGFTLVELIMVIVITGIIAASVSVFFKPAVDSYFDTRRRAELTDMADTAVRRIGREVRRAVPNSVVVSPDSKCLQFIPSKTGGLYRQAVDPDNLGSKPLDTTGPDSSFDVLSELSDAPVAGDFVVIGNQNTGDVYAWPVSPTRGTVLNWVVPPAPGGATVGVGRLTLDAPTQFPSGYDGGRFFVVDRNEPRVFYICSGAQLLRATKTLAQDATCPVAGEPIAQRVDPVGCSFTYDPNQGATQQAGFVWMNIQLLDSEERVSLSYGVHVSNVP